MRFFTVIASETKKGLELQPDFSSYPTDDIMIRGGGFYAVLDPKTNLWSTDQHTVGYLIDEEINRSADERINRGEPIVSRKTYGSYISGVLTRFNKYVREMPDSYTQLDQEFVFLNQKVKPKDYASKRLPYDLEDGDITSWNQLLSVLYEPTEREKIEWAIGSLVAGDSKKIQKFYVLYGDPGTGKSTIINIIEMLFEGYTTTFDGDALGNRGGDFAMEAFRTSPLVALQHDGDMSKIESNARLNSIISHENMIVNEKYAKSYTMRVNATLFMGTNKPVMITDMQSGLLRRMIDIHPTGNRLSTADYERVMADIPFRLGAIAKHCYEVYKRLGRDYYKNYRPEEMISETNDLNNFVEEYYFQIAEAEDGLSLKQLFTWYREYCEEGDVRYRLPKTRFKSEIRTYFSTFEKRKRIDNKLESNWFSGFSMPGAPVEIPIEHKSFLDLGDHRSKLDEALWKCPAQLAKRDGTPRYKWVNVKTELCDIDTEKLHYVKVPENHIVIDFDLTDEAGNKSLEENLKAAESFPPTYAEVSKSGQGLHLHYNYIGPTELLAPLYAEGIEVKVYRGDSSLRRKLTSCNSEEVATISGGLPLKERRDDVKTPEEMKSEKSIRNLIERNLKKEIHPSTKSSIDFIKKILDDAYESGMPYDVSDMRGRISSFALRSSNQSDLCLKTVKQMKWKSEVSVEDAANPVVATDEPRLVFYDLEVYPNFFGICWKFEGSEQVVKMINPTPQDVEPLLKLKLVGFNNRRYDNHILWARYLGYDNAALYALSQALIDNDRNATFPEAYNLSYLDIYEMSSKKQSLKKFEIELGIDHIEMDIPWDQPVPDDKIDKVMDYCANDVKATEVVFKSRKADFMARQILASLSGLPLNATTQKHAAQIIFQGDKNAVRQFVYTNLATGEIQ